MRFVCPLLLLVVAASQLSAQSAPPNVLVIVADDLGYSDIGVHGPAPIPTPNIDRLARRGARCTDGYVAAPYCSPSRASFLTGRSSTRFGHEFNPHVGDEAVLGLPLDETTIADHLRAAGYATALFGKWHQGFDAAHHPQSRGFDEYFGFLVGGHNFVLHREAEPKFGSAHSHDLIYRGRQVERLDGYTTDLFTDETISFVDRHPDKPWFVYLAYNAVHTPLESLERHQPRIPAEIIDRERRGYLSLLIGMDDAIGRILDRLDRSERDRNTLIFFFSDNGGSGRKPFLAYNAAANKPLRGDKGQTLEGGIRVPFFVSWPGQIAAESIYKFPVTTLDVLPTALVNSVADSNAKPSIPTSVEGVDLLPHLKGESKQPPHALLAWRFGPQKAVRKGDWKLVDWRDFESKTQSGWQLYNLADDISETVDMTSTHPDKVVELTRDWEAWNEKNIAPRWQGSPNEDPTAPSVGKSKKK